MAFKQVEKSALEGAEKEAEHAEDITRLEMLRSLAADHNLLGNKLNSIAKRMKTNARCKDNKERCDENVRINNQTLKAYFHHAEKAAKKKELSDEKKRQIKANWYRKRPGKVKNENEREAVNTKYEDQLQSLQQSAQEIHEMRQQMEQCDVTNIIHSANIARMAEAHVRRANRYMEGLKSEARKVKNEHNSSNKVGIKNISRAFGDNRAQPMVTVERGRDTHHDGGKCGEPTSNPRDIDSVVKRAWQAIHNGM